MRVSPIALEPVAAEPKTTAEARSRRVALSFRAFMEALGLDLRDPNLVGTEWRVARAYGELLAGHYAEAEPRLRSFPNSEGYAEPVSVTDIGFHSLCAHHFLPFFGTAHVAYVPGKSLVGLSKLSRVVDFYARRPQLQERMTEQIAALVERQLRPAGTLVVIRARHLCMEMRGVGKAGLTTTTSAIRGVFKDSRLRRGLPEPLSGSSGTLGEPWSASPGEDWAD